MRDSASLRISGQKLDHHDGQQPLASQGVRYYLAPYQDGVFRVALRPKEGAAGMVVSSVVYILHYKDEGYVGGFRSYDPTDDTPARYILPDSVEGLIGWRACFRVRRYLSAMTCSGDLLEYTGGGDCNPPIEILAEFGDAIGVDSCDMTGSFGPAGISVYFYDRPCIPIDPRLVVYNCIHERSRNANANAFWLSSASLTGIATVVKPTSASLDDLSIAIARGANLPVQNYGVIAISGKSGVMITCPFSASTAKLVRQLRPIRFGPTLLCFLGDDFSFSPRGYVCLGKVPSSVYGFRGIEGMCALFVRPIPSGYILKEGLSPIISATLKRGSCAVDFKHYPTTPPTILATILYPSTACASAVESLAAGRYFSSPETTVNGWIGAKLASMADIPLANNKRGGQEADNYIGSNPISVRGTVISILPYPGLITSSPPSVGKGQGWRHYNSGGRCFVQESSNPGVAVAPCKPCIGTTDATFRQWAASSLKLELNALLAGGGGHLRLGSMPGCFRGTVDTPFGKLTFTPLRAGSTSYSPFSTNFPLGCSTLTCSPSGMTQLLTAVFGYQGYGLLARESIGGDLHLGSVPIISPGGLTYVSGGSDISYRLLPTLPMRPNLSIETSAQAGPASS